MKWEHSIFEDLVGKKIVSICVNDKMISFDTRIEDPTITKNVKELPNNKGYYTKYTREDKLRLTYVVDGDCCSESWFSDILDADKIGYVKVLAIEYIEEDIKNYNLDDGRKRQEEDQVYGYGIRTDRGLCKIFYRNSSNGYYSGYISKYETDKSEVVLMEPVYDNWKNNVKNSVYVDLGNKND